jgi:hypothetical protein
VPHMCIWEVFPIRMTIRSSVDKHDPSIQFYLKVGSEILKLLTIKDIYGTRAIRNFSLMFVRKVHL